MKTLIANWKMNHTILESIGFVRHFLSLKPDLSKINVFLASSFISLYPLQQEIAKSGSSLSLCAQNMYMESKGAFTGEVSAEMIRSAGCSAVLIGHSERRSLFHETSENVYRKYQTALEFEIMPIVCFGESLDTYNKKDTVPFIKSQIDMFPSNHELLFAYEPIWSIGSGLIPSKTEIEVVVEFVKKMFPRAKVLYGGSVNPKNIDMLCSLQSIDGFLVGGASLLAESLFSILNSMIKIDSSS